MPIAAFATLAVLSVSPGSPPPAVRPPAAPARPAVVAARAGHRLPVGDLYSARAKRRMASYLRMRLLELREQGLRRAVEVVEGRLSLDQLLRAP